MYSLESPLCRKNFLGTQKRSFVIDLQKESELALVNEPSVFELLRFDCSGRSDVAFSRSFLFARVRLSEYLG